MMNVVNSCCRIRRVSRSHFIHHEIDRNAYAAHFATDREIYGCPNWCVAKKCRCCEQFSTGNIGKDVEMFLMAQAKKAKAERSRAIEVTGFDFNCQNPNSQERGAIASIPHVEERRPGRRSLSFSHG